MSSERIFDRAQTLVAKAVEARAKIFEARAVPAMGTGSPLPTVPAHRPSDYVASHASKAGLDDDIN